MKTFRILWCVSLILAAQVSAQNAPPPVPQWISAGPANSPIAFQTRFKTDARLLKAILLGASDARFTVHLNGEYAGEISGTNRATSLDVTAHLLRGTNVLMLQCDQPNPGARASVLLELNYDLAKVQWVTSDATWSASTNIWAGLGPPAEQPKWQPVAFTQPVDAIPPSPFDPKVAFDAYNSWKLALSTNTATDPATFTLAKGFKAELIRSAQPGEGSWISLAFDPKGRLTLARENRGLLRATLGKKGVEKVEVINDTLLECRGLLYAHDSLYADANNSKGFYRLRSTHHDDNFDEVKLLLRTGGNVGHGRNHVVLGPDGAIWLVHGNNVTLTDRIAADSPLQHYQNDSLIPCPFDSSMFDGDVNLPAGHIIRTDAEGKKFELFAAGFRNPLDIAFNSDGEMFTFDADMEWDVGSPWYRPNRINHVISGADFGWRRGTAKFPDYFPETLPSTLDIGLASPTGIEFGTRSHFPHPYNDALFVADWAYGRVLAVHLKPQGASYSARSELFLSGRPLNVTDFTFGPDGAMYLITGGRGTQSGLYRISYRGPPIPLPPTSRKELALEHQATQARRLRHALELYHSSHRDRSTERAVEFIWPRLGHSDLWIRHAARVAIEHQPLALWQHRALTETNIDIALTAGIALTHMASSNIQPALLSRVIRLPFERMTEQQQLEAFRLCELACARFGRPASNQIAALRYKLAPLYPARDWRLNHRLCVLLVYLQARDVIPRTLNLLSSVERPEDLMQFLFYLRYVQEGWTPEERAAWMDAFSRAEQKQGARDYYAVLARIKDEFLKAAPPEEVPYLAKANHRGEGALPSSGGNPATRPFVRNWQLSDFEARAVNKTASAENGKRVFQEAQCLSCHRFGNEGAFLGPDLTAVASRFDARAILESIIEPSKVIDDKFRNVKLTLRDGNVIVGALDSDTADKLIVRENLLATNTVEISKAELIRRDSSDTSPMPSGLLNTFTKPEILDLIAFLQSGPALR